MLDARAGMVVFGVSSCPPLLGQEGGIEVFAGETIWGGGSRFSLTEIYKRDDGLRSGTHRADDPLNREWWESRVVLGYDYGVRPDTQISILVPYVHRELEIGGAKIDADGLGDVAVLGKHRIYKRDWRQGSFNVALVGGLELPTGETSAKTGGVRNPPMVQPGSGSVDPFLAAAFNLGSGRSRVDLLLLYKANSEGSQQFEEGDFFVTALSTGYRFINMEYPGPTVAGVFGINYQHRSRSEQNGSSLANSGSDRVFLHWAISAHPRPNLDLAVSLDHPIYSDYNGTQLARELQLTFNFGYRF